MGEWEKCVCEQTDRSRSDHRGFPRLLPAWSSTPTSAWLRWCWPRSGCPVSSANTYSSCCLRSRGEKQWKFITESQRGAFLRSSPEHLLSPVQPTHHYIHFEAMALLINWQQRSHRSETSSAKLQTPPSNTKPQFTFPSPPRWVMGPITLNWNEPKPKEFCRPLTGPAHALRLSLHSMTHSALR